MKRHVRLVVNDCANPFYSLLIHSIQQTAEKHGHAVSLSGGGERIEREAEGRAAGPPVQIRLPPELRVRRSCGCEPRERAA